MKILSLLCAIIVALATANAQAQTPSDSCSDGQTLVVDTTNKRYKCVSSPVRLASAQAVTATNPSASTPLMEFSIPAGAFNGVDRFVKITGGGTYTTAAAQTPLVALSVSLCTVSGCASGTVIPLAAWTTNATTANVTNGWYLQTEFTVAAAGATGTVESNGLLFIQLGATGGTKLITPTTVVTGQILISGTSAPSAAVDLTAPLFVTVTATMSTANAGNNVRQRTGSVQGVY